jgi:hypothetical protein
LRSPKRVLLLIAAAGVFACGRDRVEESARPLVVSLAPAAGTRPARIIVTGVDEASLRALRSAPGSGSPWDSLFRVTVGPANAPAVAGRYVATDTALEFEPLFPLDPGRDYSVHFDPRRLATPRRDSMLVKIVALPARTDRAPSTTVTGIYPTNNEVPENQLRLYVTFSAAMSRQPGIDFVHLIDDHGQEVKNAFLPLEADFWNPDHTRYTLFLDPGRVKRGITPNEQMGRPLHSGRAYALVIDSTWRDANGLPLVKPFRYEFRAGPAFEQGIDLKTWRIAAPRAGTRDTLTVTFARSLDHGLLQRALGVERGGQSILGDVTIAPAEVQWKFVPRQAWTAGDYQLVVLSILEDVAGNRVGRAFEVDMFERVDSTAKAEKNLIPFKVR